jgi:Zn-dependent protease/CBS domain-containing protein
MNRPKYLEQVREECGVRIMFGKPIKLFRIFGIPIQIDLTWLLLGVLVSWSLASTVFPSMYEDLSTSTYWAMSLVATLGLFFSIIFHEVSHSLMARRHQMPVKGITLFIFGGVAEMEDEPPDPKGEFLMAIAGPMASVVIALVCFVISAVLERAGSPVTVTGVFSFVGWINTILVIFNLLPAFPLDGGRVLRSALWKWKGRLRWATRIASQIGSGFGLALILIGFLWVFGGAFVRGMWWILIGFFLRSAARMSYQQLLIRRVLEGEPVRRFMSPNPATVPPDITIAELVEEYVYRYHFKMFPVAEDGKLLGCISTRQIKEVPQEQWSQKKVGEVYARCSDENAVRPDEDAVRVLSRMSRTGQSRMMVVQDGQLVGLVSLKDLIKFIALKIDLEMDEEVGPIARA